MTIKTETILICTGCGKTEQLVRSRFGDIVSPKAWHKLEPDHQHSRWTTADMSASGDFCSLECIVSYVQKAIERRDKPVIVGGELIVREVEIDGVTVFKIE